MTKPKFKLKSDPMICDGCKKHFNILHLRYKDPWAKKKIIFKQYCYECDKLY